MVKTIKDRITESIQVKEKILKNKEIIENISLSIEVITRCIKNGGKIFIAGNGGSAADAQHFAGEMIGKFLKIRKALPAIALTTDTSVLTSLSNDISYDIVFERQLEALANEKDIFIAISTIGNSKNLIKALNYCRKNNIKTIGLTGKSGGKMKGLVDILINVPSDITPRTQEAHLLIYHIICEFVETNFLF